MNRRGELEKAMSEAWVEASSYALFTQMLRRAGNTTGEMPDDRFMPKLETLFRQAKLTRSPGYRALAELEKHGWFRRYVTADRSKVAGLLMVGKSCDCHGEPTATCEREGCGRPLEGKRPDARYCSHKCKQRVWRQSRKAVTRVPQRRNARPLSGTHKIPLAVTNSTPVQVQRTEAVIESSKRAAGKRTVLGDLVRCPFCDQTAIVGQGVIEHRPDCWRGGMWALYESEAA